MLNRTHGRVCVCVCVFIIVCREAIHGWLKGILNNYFSNRQLEHWEGLDEKKLKATPLTFTLDMAIQGFVQYYATEHLQEAV